MTPTTGIALISNADERTVNPDITFLASAISVHRLAETYASTFGDSCCRCGATLDGDGEGQHTRICRNAEG